MTKIIQILWSMFPRQKKAIRNHIYINSFQLIKYMYVKKSLIPTIFEVNLASCVCHHPYINVHTHYNLFIWNHWFGLNFIRIITRWSHFSRFDHLPRWLPDPMIYYSAFWIFSDHLPSKMATTVDYHFDR